MATGNSYLLALDQGTTSSRALLIDQQGQLVGMAQQEFRQIYPEPGWVEHDAMEIWDSQAKVVRELLGKLNGQDRLVGIGITNQRETTIVWDRRTGRPLANAIVWQDRRTAAYCEQLKAKGYSERIQSKTGLVIDAYFSASKIRWILEQIPGARDKAQRGELAAGTVDSWLIWQLTRGRLHATDATNASRTMLYNIHSGEWDQELLDLFEVPKSMLPEVKSSSEIFATVDKDLFGHAAPIAGVAGDQQAALFGQLCLEPGMMKNTYGTGCFLVLNTGNKPIVSQNNLLTTVAWRLGKETTYALEGSVFIGGAVVQWLRDGLGIIAKSKDVEALAAQAQRQWRRILRPQHSPDSAPRIGIPTPVVRSSASPVARAVSISPAPRWRLLPIRPAMWWKPCVPTQTSRLRNCASTAERPPTPS